MDYRKFRCRLSYRKFGEVGGPFGVGAQVLAPRWFSHLFFLGRRHRRAASRDARVSTVLQEIRRPFRGEGSDARTVVTKRTVGEFIGEPLHTLVTRWRCLPSESI